MLDIRDCVELKGSRNVSVLALVILVLLETILSIPLVMLIRNFKLHAGGGSTFLSAAIIIIPIAAILCVMIRYIAQLFCPDILTLSPEMVKFSSNFRTFSYLWCDIRPVEIDVRHGIKGERSYYVNFIPKDGSEPAGLFLGAFGHDYKDVYRALSAAQDGDLIDLGRPSIGASLGWILLVSGILIFVLWKVVGFVRHLA